MTGGSGYPGLANLNDMLFYADGKPKQEVVDVQLAVIENNYIQTMGFTILSGRAFSNKFQNDSAGIILNETAVKQFGYTNENVVGKKIRFDLNAFHGVLDVVGVVKNFNFESLHHDIKPFGFMTNIFGSPYGYLIARSAPVTNGSEENAETWAKLNRCTFCVQFPRPSFRRLYEKDQRVSNILISFMVIAIFIACLALGLAAFSAEQRKRKSHRKVLGASVTRLPSCFPRIF